MPVPSKQPIYKIQLADPVEPGTTNRPTNDLEVNIDVILDFIRDSLIGEFEFQESASTGLTFKYKGGKIRLDDGTWSIPDGSLALTGNLTNYIELDPTSQTITSNTSGFTRGSVPLWSADTTFTEITSYTDYRALYSGNRAQDVSIASAKFTATDVLAALEWLADNVVRNTGDLINGDVDIAGNLDVNDVTAYDIQGNSVSGKNGVGAQVGVGGTGGDTNEVWTNSAIEKNKIDFVNRALSIWTGIEAGTAKFNGIVDASGNKVINVGAPTVASDAATKGYVDQQFVDAFTFGGLTTKMLFASWPLPPGWALDSTFNDRAVMITSNSSLTGTTGGSWTISGMNNAGGHDHGGQTGTSTKNQWRGTSENTAPAVGIDDHRHSISADGDHAHTFDGGWRPYHVKLVLGVFNG